MIHLLPLPPIIFSYYFYPNILGQDDENDVTEYDTYEEWLKQ